MVVKLRQIDVLMAEGRQVADAVRTTGMTEVATVVHRTIIHRSAALMYLTLLQVLDC